MSKQLEALIKCQKCRNEFKATLYRTIWLEDQGNRDLVFSDKINVVVCPKCKERTKLEFPFLATNIDKNIAVWYEPYHDPQIDADQRSYAQHMGRDSFYAKAPRVSGWEMFKETISKLEKQNINKNTNVVFSGGILQFFSRFIKNINKAP